MSNTTTQNNAAREAGQKSAEEVLVDLKRACEGLLDIVERSSGGLYGNSRSVINAKAAIRAFESL